MNLCHRARVGKDAHRGDLITFNFFRQLRAMIETLNVDKIFVVFEGNPVAKKTLYPEYKANRIDTLVDVAATSRRQHFWQQSNQIREVLTYFPVTMLVHDEQEADDTVYNVVRDNIAATADLCTVVSTDTDFIQMLQEFPSTAFQLYNPIRKEFVSPPAHSYVMWKSLKGDSADGIPGIPGVGDKTAMKWLNSRPLFEEKMKEKSTAHMFHRNMKLIKFEAWTEAVKNCIKSKIYKYDEDRVKSTFENLEFKTMVTDKSWNKFNDTFASIS